MRILIASMIILALFACKSDNNTQKNVIKEKIEGAKDEALATKLYQNYTATPTTQAQKDENLIIDYLVTRNLDFERYPSGLYVLIKKKGSGPNYIKGQPARVDYRGFFLNGRIFDSSFAKGVPMDFKMGQMIDGWNQAMANMNPGTEATIIVPSHLAYADKGFPGAVPPNTVIAFDKYYKSIK